MWPFEEKGQKKVLRTPEPTPAMQQLSWANPKREKHLNDTVTFMNNNHGRTPKTEEELQNWVKNNPHPRF